MEDELDIALHVEKNTLKQALQMDIKASVKMPTGKMYTGCAFASDWDNGILEMNQTAFAKNMVEQSNISATSNILGSPGVA